MSCLVPCCSNTVALSKRQRKNLSFYSLPKSVSMCRRWFRAIGGTIPPREEKSAKKICSEHFDIDAYVHPSYFEIENRRRKTGVYFLLPTAMPTLKLRAETETRIARAIRTPKNSRSRSSSKRKAKANHIVENNNTPVADIQVGFPTLNANPVPSSSSSTLLSSHNDSTIAEDRSERSSKIYPKQPGIELEYKSRMKEKGKRSCSTGESPVQKIPRRCLEEESREESESLVGSEVSIDEVVTEEESLKREIARLKSEVYSYKAVRMSERNALRERHEKAEATCAALALELQDTEDRREKMTSEIARLQTLNKELEAKLAFTHSGKIEQNESPQADIRGLLDPYFTQGQMQCIFKGQRSAKWSADDCAMAICLYSVSKKAYNHIRTRLNYPLPSLSFLRKWALTMFDTTKGFLKDVLILMKEKGKSLTTMDKICVLISGEIDLTREICFDAKSQKVIGPCDKALVIMVRGLFSNWKQPIYYEFDKTLDKETLDEALSLLYIAGYDVVATTIDIENKNIWEELGINEINHHFHHPTIKDRIIYVFADVPHLLKQLRDSFFDHGLLLSGSQEMFTPSSLANIINYGNSQSDDPRIAQRLTNCVLNARVNSPRAVWPAARMWSRSVAVAVELAGEKGFSNSKEYQKQSDFILAVNDWFDLHNSKKKIGEHRGVNAYGLDVRCQDTTLRLMNILMQTTRVGGQETLAPFQEGVIISNASLRGLHNYLENRFPKHYKYLITRRLQQDVMENFFLQIRMMGSSDQLSSYDFRNRFHAYLLGRDSDLVFCGNENIPEESLIQYRSWDSGYGQTTNNFTPISAAAASMLSRNSGDYLFSRLQDFGRDDRYFTDPQSLMSTIRETSRSNAVLVEDTSLISNREGPAYEYEPDSGDLVVLTAELFADIIHSLPQVMAEDAGDSDQTDRDSSNLATEDTDDVQQDVDITCVKNDHF